MTAKELQKRNGKSENLRVLQTEDGSYFCESSEGKILYNININDDGMSCTCGDWAPKSTHLPTPFLREGMTTVDKMGIAAKMNAPPARTEVVIKARREIGD